MPAYTGLHLDKEINNLSLKKQAPSVLIIGGAKIATKLPVINNFLNKVDYILIGGAVANNFLAALGYEIGQSKYDKEYIKAAQKIIAKATPKIILPVDVITKSKTKCADEVKSTEMILDIGPNTIKWYSDIIKNAKTIIWNGPMGKFEDKKYALGTLGILNAILKSKARIIIGGGDTDVVLHNKKLPKNIFVSSGGGAMLDFLAGKKLPGLK